MTNGFRDSQNIYRVETWFYFPGRGLTPACHHALPDDRPRCWRKFRKIKAQTHLIPERMTATVGDRQFSEYVDVVDPGFFKRDSAAAGGGESGNGLCAAGFGRAFANEWRGNISATPIL
jgi:hypothetical protein